MKSEHLIQILIDQTKQIINKVDSLKIEKESILNWRSDTDSWSILECLEHLNLYGNFYLPEIEKAIVGSKTKNETEFKSGFLGNYFADSILPKEKTKKMKTFKSKNPLHSNLNQQKVFDDFRKQQIKLIELLNLSQNVSLNKVKIKTSISVFIRINLGDTFRFIINHNLRHLKQIEKIEERIKKSA